VGGLDEIAFGQSSLGTLRVCVASPGDLPHRCACCDTRDSIAPGVQGGAAHWSGSRAEVVLPVQALLEATAEDKQASVLAGVERVRHACPRPPSEAIWLVVVACAIAVKRPETATQVVLLFLKLM
jgi:hypothetical protein